MTNKNPFEIRLDVLAMAKDYLDKMYETNRAFAEAAYFKAVELNQAEAENWKKYVPTQYTMEELMQKAQEMSAFINGLASPAKKK